MQYSFYRQAKKEGRLTEHTKSIHEAERNNKHLEANRPAATPDYPIRCRKIATKVRKTSQATGKRKGWNTNYVQVEILNVTDGTSQMCTLQLSDECMRDIVELRYGSHPSVLQSFRMFVEDIGGMAIFAETVIRFMQDEKGVDFSDPDWGLDDESIPFSTGFVTARKVFDYYFDLPEYLLDNLPWQRHPEERPEESFPMMQGHTMMLAHFGPYYAQISSSPAMGASVDPGNASTWSPKTSTRVMGMGNVGFHQRDPKDGRPDNAKVMHEGAPGGFYRYIAEVINDPIYPGGSPVNLDVMLTEKEDEECTEDQAVGYQQRQKFIDAYEDDWWPEPWPPPEE